MSKKKDFTCPGNYLFSLKKKLHIHKKLITGYILAIKAPDSDFSAKMFEGNFRIALAHQMVTSVSGKTSAKIA